jgi:hypothetical protein
MERLRVGATSSTTDVRLPAAEPHLVCAWPGHVLGQLPAASGQENSRLAVTVDCGGSWGPREEQRPMPMLFPHDPRRAMPFMGVLCVSGSFEKFLPPPPPPP